MNDNDKTSNENYWYGPAKGFVVGVPIAIFMWLLLFCVIRFV